MLIAGLLLAALTAGVNADEGLGIEARGVSPWAALSGSSRGLDLRDAFNRPVSRAAVERDLKRLSVQTAAANAYASRLPRAREVLPLLEMLAEIRASLRSALSAGLPAVVWALAPSRVELKIVLALVLLAGVLFAPALPALAAAACPRPASGARLKVLRC